MRSVTEQCRALSDVIGAQLRDVEAPHPLAVQRALLARTLAKVDESAATMARLASPSE